MISAGFGEEGQSPNVIVFRFFSGQNRVIRYSSPVMSFRRVAAALILILLALVGCSEAGLSEKEHFTGYFSPILSEDARYVYYVSRDTLGRVNGPGVEFFTPPAKVKIDADRFVIHRMELSTRKDEVLAELPDSPLAAGNIDTYRSRIFTCATAHLRFNGDKLEYEMVVSSPTHPSTITWRAWRTWTDTEFTGSSVWVGGHREFSGIAEDQLRGDLEVVTVPGPECFPSAIVTIDHSTGEFTTLLASAHHEDEYPEGVSAAVVFAASKRDEIRRVREIRSAHEEILRALLAEGMPEGEARLETNREMARRGYYPKPTMIVASHVEGDPPDGIRVFEISSAEFGFGMFSDIEKAIAAPETEVEKSIGAYVKHQDFETSPRLNEWIDSGKTQFVVKTESGMWLVEIRK